MLRDQYELYKNAFVFPDSFPEIQSIEISKGKLYILTWAKSYQKNEIFIYTAAGKFIKTCYIPFYMIDAFRPQPFAIYDGKIYQVIENEDDEIWELHVNEIK